MSSNEHKVPSFEEIRSYLDKNNWGRWGDKGAAGAMNLITDEKRKRAAGNKMPSPGRRVIVSKRHDADQL